VHSIRGVLLNAPHTEIESTGCPTTLHKSTKFLVQKAIEDEVSLGLPFVVYILANSAFENLSCIECEGRMGYDRKVEERFELFPVVQDAMRCFHPGTSGEVVLELQQFLAGDGEAAQQIEECSTVLSSYCS
jgi:hypothetical protein